MTQRVRRTVAILVTPRNMFLREVLRGVARYARSQSDWALRTIGPSASEVRPLLSLKPDGVIVDGGERSWVEAVAARGVCGVDIASRSQSTPLPRARPDHHAIGRLAADHLADLGLEQFACRPWGGAFGQWRYEGYCQRLAERGFPPPWVPGRPMDHSATAAWIRSLPKPLGIFAIDDQQGLDLLEACLEAGVDVPSEAAVLGVNNDDVVCELARPALSSISPAAEAVGYTAASLLDQLMAGATVAAETLVAPDGVIARQSTDLIAVDDPAVADAVRFIRQRFHEVVSIDEVAEAVALGRRVLEDRFRAALGRTPFAELRRTRLEHARRLLAHTDLPMPKVAAAAGFPSAERLSIVFRQQLGMTPTQCREASRPERTATAVAFSAR